MEQPRGDAWDFINKSKHKTCISSVPKSNKNSIEFSLSTWTRSSSKASQPKFLHRLLVSFSESVPSAMYDTLHSRREAAGHVNFILFPADL